MSPPVFCPEERVICLKLTEQIESLASDLQTDAEEHSSLMRYGSYCRIYDLANAARSIFGQRGRHPEDTRALLVPRFSKNAP